MSDKIRWGLIGPGLDMRAEFANGLALRARMRRSTPLPRARRRKQMPLARNSARRNATAATKTWRTTRMWMSRTLGHASQLSPCPIRSFASTPARNVLCEKPFRGECQRSEGDDRLRARKESLPDGRLLDALFPGHGEAAQTAGGQMPSAMSCWSRPILAVVDR